MENEKNSKSKKILIGVLGVLIVLIILVIALKILNNDIKSITLRYSTSSEYLYGNEEDIVELEITGDNFKKIKELLKEVNEENCECIYIEEAQLIIDKEYSITIGEGGFGYKSEIGDSATSGYLVSVPDELYDLVKKIIKEQANKK